MMKEKTAKLVRKIALSSAKNAVNRKLILILHEPEVHGEKGKVNSGNRRVTAFKTNFAAFRKF